MSIEPGLQGPPSSTKRTNSLSLKQPRNRRDAGQVEIFLLNEEELHRIIPPSAFWRATHRLVMRMGKTKFYEAWATGDSLAGIYVQVSGTTSYVDRRNLTL